MLMMGDPQHIPMNTYTMFLLIYQNDANLGNIHKLDDTRLHSGIIHYDLAQVALAQGNLLWALWRLLAALIVFYAFEHHTAIQLTLQSLADTLRQSDQPHLAEQCEHLATQLDMPSVTNLIFDIRELLFATN